MRAPAPRFQRLTPPPRSLPWSLAVRVGGAEVWAQIGLAAAGVGVGLLASAAWAGRREDLAPALLFAAMGAVMLVAGRGRRRQRLELLRRGRVARAAVVRVESHPGAGEYRAPYSMRLRFADAEGRERITSYDAELFGALHEGDEVELFYDESTPLDTTPEGERARVPEHRRPLLALELPRAVAVDGDGALASAGIGSVLLTLLGALAGLALPISTIVRSLLR